MEDADGKEPRALPPPLMPFVPPPMMNMIPGHIMPPYPMLVPLPPKMLSPRSMQAKKRKMRPRKGEYPSLLSESPNCEEDAEETMNRRSFISTKGRERVQNDYNQRFVDTGDRPQNFVRDTGEDKRFGEYPKQDRLLHLKREIITKRATPARHIRADLRNFSFDDLKVLFDVVLVNPPWRTKKMREEKLNFGWTYDDLVDNIPMDRIVDAMSFCFIWCDFYSLDDARNALRHWGFRKCEDICWLKTNCSWRATQGNPYTSAKVKDMDAIIPPSLLHKTTERCLVGLRGPIRRNEDDYFVHSNLDTDVIISEEPDPLRRLQMELDLNVKQGPDMQMNMDAHLIKMNPKPEEIYNIIDRFCLGRRKLELFGSDDTIRNGWVTIGPGVSTTNYNAEEFLKWTSGSTCWPQVQDYRGGRLMGTSEEIENLRPKSPAKMGGKDYSDARENNT